LENEKFDSFKDHIIS